MTKYEAMKKEYEELLTRLEITKKEKLPEYEEYFNIMQQATHEFYQSRIPYNITDCIIYAMWYNLSESGIDIGIFPQNTDNTIIQDMKDIKSGKLAIPNGENFNVPNFEIIEYYYLTGQLNERHMTYNNYTRNALDYLRDMYGPTLKERKEELEPLHKFVDSVLLVKKVQTMPREDLEKYYTELFYQNGDKSGKEADDFIELEQLREKLTAMGIPYQTFPKYRELLAKKEEYLSNKEKQAKEDEEAKAKFNEELANLTDEEIRQKMLETLNPKAQAYYDQLIGHAIKKENPVYEEMGERDVSGIRISKKENDKYNEQIATYKKIVEELTELLKNPLVSEISELRNMNISLSPKKENIDYKIRELRELEKKYSSASYFEKKKLEKENGMSEKELKQKIKIEETKSNDCLTARENNRIEVALRIKEVQKLLKPIIEKNASVFKDWTNKESEIIRDLGLNYQDIGNNVRLLIKEINNRVADLESRVERNNKTISNISKRIGIDIDSQTYDEDLAQREREYNLTQVPHEVDDSVIEVMEDMVTRDEEGNYIITGEMSDDAFGEMVAEAAAPRKR